MANLGIGVDLQYSTDSGSTYTTVGSIMSISGPNYSAEAIDVTNMSVSDRHRSFIGGLIDAGDVSMELQYDAAAAAHLAVRGMITDADGAVDYFKIVRADSGAEETLFTGLVTGFTVQESLGEVTTASVTIKISGKPTYA